jgi:hypothetical protein
MTGDTELAANPDAESPRNIRAAPGKRDTSSGGDNWADLEDLNDRRPSRGGKAAGSLPVPRIWASMRADLRSPSSPTAAARPRTTGPLTGEVMPKPQPAAASADQLAHSSQHP